MRRRLLPALAGSLLRFALPASTLWGRATALYQLNMLAAYLEHGLTETAVSSSSVRLNRRLARAIYLGVVPLNL